MTIAIRYACDADLPAIKLMMREFVDHWAEEGEPEDVSDAEIDRIEPLVFGPGAPCKVLLAEEDGQPAGYLTYFWGLSMDGVGPALFVGDLFVRRAWRQRGAGRALMQEARAVAREAGALQVNWTVWYKNHAARKFYEALGAAPYEEEILMTWPLRSPRD